MLFVRGMALDQGINLRGRTSILDRLQEYGLAPLIRTAHLAAYNLALPGRGKELERSIIEGAEREDGNLYLSGDLFCLDDCVLFIVFQSEASSKRGLRVGIVYDGETNDWSRRLDEFRGNVQAALTSSGALSVPGKSEEEAGPYTRWKSDFERVAAGFERFRKAQPESTSSNPGAMFSAGRLRAMEVLESAEARNLLRRIADAHRAIRVTDLTGEGDHSQNGEGALARMSDAGLLKREVLVSCRTSDHALFRLPSAESLGVITASNAICTECGAAIADERAEELITPTEMGSELLRNSSWLAIRIYNFLRRLGLSEHDMIVRSDDDGESRILANVCGELFLIAARDGSVSTINARRFLDEQSELEATHLVVIATGKIEDEARVRLREHVKRQRRSGSELELILMEGAESAPAELQHSCERVSSRAIINALCDLDNGLGMSLGQLVAARARLIQRTGALTELAASAAGALAGSL